MYPEASEVISFLCTQTKGEIATMRNQLEEKSLDELKDMFINLTVLQATLQQVRMKKKASNKQVRKYIEQQEAMDKEKLDEGFMHTTEFTGYINKKYSKDGSSDS